MSYVLSGVSLQLVDQHSHQRVIPCCDKYVAVAERQVGKVSLSTANSGGSTKMLSPLKRPISSKLLFWRTSLRLRSDMLETLNFRTTRLFADLTLTLYDEDDRRKIFRISQLL